MCNSLHIFVTFPQKGGDINFFQSFNRKYKNYTSIVNVNNLSLSYFLFLLLFLFFFNVLELIWKVLPILKSEENYTLLKQEENWEWNNEKMLKKNGCDNQMASNV